MPYATSLDAVEIYYEVRGSRGIPLILLAGQSNTHHWWDAACPDFEGARRVVVLDWRGTGRSAAPDDDSYSTRGFATDVLAVMDHLGIDRADVYGTSMGGRVAQWLAVDHPGRVRALVLGCTSPGGAHSVERSAEVRRALSQPDADAAQRALAELMYTPAYLARHPGPHHTLGDPAMSDHARRQHLRASARHDAWDVLPSIIAPTLVVHGSDDRFNPTANAELLAGRIPGARMHLIPQARHAYFEEFRSTASPLVLEFLDQARLGQFSRR
ncbi:alpha/beta fold hydrolase [Nocardia concava]|uniref:alpha/beta fold hydrolase n=1 Tax=Nocardia concava TaxID=257281 RepID=UPI00030A5325|nr:alpha/beta fold hydrolase [Nocardia concava]